MAYDHHITEPVPIYLIPPAIAEEIRKYGDSIADVRISIELSFFSTGINSSLSQHSSASHSVETVLNRSKHSTYSLSFNSLDCPVIMAYLPVNYSALLLYVKSAK
jgi:hypothetical protein